MMHASRNRIIALNLISFLGQGSLYMMNLAFVYYIRYTIGASALAVGVAGAVYNLTYLIGCLLLIPRLSAFRKSRLIIMAYAGMGLSIGLLMMTRSLPLIYLCLAAYGAFMSLVWPSVEGWLTEGLKVAEVALLFGADDVGGVLMDEMVVRAAGIDNRATAENMRAAIRSAGFRPRERGGLYETLREF